MEDLGELALIDRFQLFVAAFELFESFHDRFSHSLVGFLGPSHQGKFIARGHTLVTILVVQPDADEPRLAFGCRFNRGSFV